MFANTSQNGQNMAMPDVCKVPAPPAPPIPTPFPNIAMLNQANPGTACKKVFIMNMPAHNLNTQTLMSSGDEAGAIGGMVSSMIIGPSKHTMGAQGINFENSPATKLTSPTQQNGSNANCMGMTIAPSQTKVMVMK